jgi:hypothetical protein
MMMRLATQTTSTEKLGRNPVSNTGHINRTREEPSEQHRPHQYNKGGLATQTTSTEQGSISNTDHINRTRKY